MKKPKKKPSKLSKLSKKPFQGTAIPFKRDTKTTEEKISDAIKTVPRITDETVEEHREEVLGSARKYIYPLQHSKNRVVKISLSLFLVVVIAFFVVTGLELYKLQNTGGFFYAVTKILPFPVAKAGNNWISYESYLFELRRSTHYYHTQQQAAFSGKSGQAQLQHLKQQAMDQVIQDAYVKQLAKANGVSVSDADVNNEITLLRSENQLGSSQQSLASTLSSYYGWNVNDLKRKIKQELLAQAVVAKLDTTTNNKAQAALNQLAHGADFGQLAGQVSQDPASKGNGGQYGAPITLNNTGVPPQVIAEAFKLKPGQISGIINTGYTLEIIKVLDSNGTTVHAAHIQFIYKPITDFTKPQQAAHPAHTYIKV